MAVIFYVKIWWRAVGQGHRSLDAWQKDCGSDPLQYDVGATIKSNNHQQPALGTTTRDIIDDIIDELWCDVCVMWKK
jgi:hypothetical protein